MLGLKFGAASRYGTPKMDFQHVPSCRKASKTGDRLKRLLDPLILPTVDNFPQLTCGLLIALHIIFILFAGQALHAVWPAGSEGSLLQGLYQKVKELPGTSSPLFFLVPFVLTHVITCGIYLLLDWWRPSWVQTLMAHRRAAGDWGGPDLGLTRTLLSQLNVAPATALGVTYMLARNGPIPYTRPWVASCLDKCELSLPSHAPSVVELLVHLTFCLIVSDLAYGFVHLQMHRHRGLWKHIHSIHHEYKETFVTVGPHVHPMELLVVFTISVFSPAACGAHPFTCWVWYSLYTLISLEAHTGWRQTPLGWLLNAITMGNFGGSMHHHLHHAVVWGNYAPFFTFMDKLMGTEILQADEVREPEFRNKLKVKSVKGQTAKAESKDSAQERKGKVKAEARSRAATPPPPTHR